MQATAKIREGETVNVKAPHGSEQLGLFTKLKEGPKERNLAPRVRGERSGWRRTGLWMALEAKVQT